MGRAIVLLLALACGDKSAPQRAPAPPPRDDVADLVERVRPSVVVVMALHEPRGLPDLSSVLPFGAPLPRKHEAPRPQALGAGFFFDDQGHVLTNAHVIEGADTIRVRLSDEREMTARVRARDEAIDVAVLEVDTPGAPHVTMGSSARVRIGQRVFTIGSPFGLGQSVTMGIVSGKDRVLGAGAFDDFIQTDAPINPGSSGGPLFDLDGRVVGITTAMNPNGQGIGFATPIDPVSDALPELLRSGHVARGKLGVLVEPVDAPTARALGMDRPRGALVTRVERKSAAYEAGLRGGDVITGVEGEPVERAPELARMVARHPPGARVKITVQRGTRERSFSPVLER